VVITTYNRSGFLGGLLASIAAMDPAPDGVVVVDNASTDDTPQVIRTAAAAMRIPVVHHRLAVNAGGAGGFAAGVARALDEGAEWLWLMDDDVEALPDALAKFRRWMGTYVCIHGRRWAADGTPFFWQNRFHDRLGIFLPVAGDVFAESDVFRTDVGCFEGMLVRADVVREVGLPDARFFLTWDDAIYGWLISRRHPVVYVNDFVLRKVREQRSIDLGVRHLNDSSDLSRRYVMRNRAYVANYLRAEGAYSPLWFAVGTALTAAKEVLRVAAVERRPRGLDALWRGWRESRRLRRRPWAPMPPIA